MNRTIVILLAFITSLKLNAQILPKEGARLSYTVIGFSFSAPQHASKYKIEIADGNFTTFTSFKKKIIRSIDTKKNKIIEEVPFFGRQYTWRVVYYGEKTEQNSSAFYHFSM